MANICLTSNTSWYLHNFRGRLISALIGRGHHVVALSPFDEYVPRIEQLGASHIHLEMDNRGTNPAVELLTLIRIYRNLQRMKLDLILTYTPKVNIYVSLVARLLRIPVIPNISGLGRAADSRGVVESITRRLYKLALRHSTLVFFQNEDDRTNFVHDGLITPEKTQRLPGSGVDVVRFAPRIQPARNGRFVFLLSARMLWAKGIAEFVEAARNVRSEFPSTRFWLLGFLDPSNKAAVPEAKIKEWMDEGIIEYLGVVEDVRPIYSSCQCFVLPSYYREGVPRTLLEAASMALPIITTDAPGCRDAVENDVSGYLCRPRDIGSLTARMLQILHLPQQARAAMGAAGREKMLREFDEQIVIDRYSVAVDQILTSRHVSLARMT